MIKYKNQRKPIVTIKDALKHHTKDIADGAHEDEANIWSAPGLKAIKIGDEDIFDDSAPVDAGNGGTFLIAPPFRLT